MKLKNMFQTGQSYTIKDLFNADNKIIIPDLQRDYCWGDDHKNGRNLAKDFVSNIIDKGFKNDQRKLTLGLLYGYQEIEGCIQLCDGQQRITTIFLLLGMLNRKCDNAFYDLLISDFELNEDDKEPHLQYAIREDTLYFLSDLVCEFFLKKEINSVDDICKQSWYFNDYKYDPSVQSMIRALKSIDSLLSERSEINFIELTKYISGCCVEDSCGHPTFIYYDMESRKNGEETFVIINTTGEPLSASENFKPRFITTQPIEKQDYWSKQWEEWEKWFWQNRKGNGKSKNDTADNGMIEFFRWVTLLETPKKGTYEAIQKDGSFELESSILKSPQIVQHYFEVVKTLFENYLNDNMDWLSPEPINDQIIWFQLLPIIKYVYKFPDASEREILRVKILFKNLSLIDNVRKNIGAILQQTIIHINELNEKEIYKMTPSTDLPKDVIDELQKKALIYLNPENDREDIEKAFWQSEEHKIWNGQILPLINWSFVDKKFEFKEFEKFQEVFNKIFIGECDSNIDLTRRALLTRKLKEYPKQFRGHANFSFGWDGRDWQILINDNTDEFKRFFEELIHCDNIQKTQQKMIDEFPLKSDLSNSPLKSDKSDFVHNSELIAYCNRKNIQFFDESWQLIKEINATTYANINTYKLFLEFKKKKMGQSQNRILGTIRWLHLFLFRKK